MAQDAIDDHHALVAFGHGNGLQVGQLRLVRTIKGIAPLGRIVIIHIVGIG